MEKAILIFDSLSQEQKERLKHVDAYWLMFTLSHLNRIKHMVDDDFVKEFITVTMNVD